MLSGWMAVLYRTELLGQGTQLCPAVLLHPFIAGRLEAEHPPADHADFGEAPASVALVQRRSAAPASADDICRYRDCAESLVADQGPV